MEPEAREPEVLKESVSVFPTKSMIISTKRLDTEFLPVAISWHSEVDAGDEIEETDFKMNSYHPSRTRSKPGASGTGKQAGAFHLPYPVLSDTGRPGTVECQIKGRSFSGISNPSVASGVLLCVYDPDSKELEVLPFRDVFPRMKMTTDSTDVDKSTGEQTGNAVKPSGISQFSSKAKRRRNQEITSASQKVKHSNEAVMAVEEDKDVSELMDDAKGDEVDLHLGNDIRPKPEFTAKLPENLFDWENIIPKDVLVALKPLAEEISVTLDDSVEEWKKSKKFLPYVIKLLQNIPKAAENRNERIALAVCIGYLFALFNRPMKPVMENALLPPGAPAAVRKYFSESFSAKSHLSPKQRTFTPKLKDKMMAHVLLWILRAESYTADISTLMNELRVKERAKVQQLASIIGARCSEKEGKEKTTYTLTLKHPWTFPKVSSGTPRKKRRN